MIEALATCLTYTSRLRENFQESISDLYNFLVFIIFLSSELNKAWLSDARKHQGKSAAPHDAAGRQNVGLIVRSTEDYSIV